MESVATQQTPQLTIQLSCGKGRVDIAQRHVNSDGTGRVDEARLAVVLEEMMDLRPRGIRNPPEFNRLICARTAAYGRFGRAPEADGGYSWKRRDPAIELRDEFG